MLVLEPHLLVLDEPTIGQDHERAQQLMGLMARLRERYRTTILMITHDVRLIAEWAARALVISGGRLLFDGSPEAMFADERLIAEAWSADAHLCTRSARRWPQTSWQPVAADPVRARTGGQHRAHGKAGLHEQIHRLSVPLRQFLLPPPRSAHQVRLAAGDLPARIRAYIAWVQILITIAVLFTAFMLARLSLRVVFRSTWLFGVACLSFLVIQH